jgi:hypothetical protein
MASVIKYSSAALATKLDPKAEVFALFQGAKRSDVPAPRPTIRYGQTAILKRRPGSSAHLAGIYFRFAAWADEFRFDCVAAGAVDQFHWHSRASRHPAIAPSGHGGHQGIQIKTLFREPILESRRALFVGDAAEDSIKHQFAQAVRQAMRRQLQIMLDRLEPSDAEEHVTEDQHRPAIADHRQRSSYRAGHRVDLLPSHRAKVWHNR